MAPHPPRPRSLAAGLTFLALTAWAQAAPPAPATDLEHQLREGKASSKEIAAALKVPVDLDARQSDLGSALLLLKKAAGPDRPEIAVLVNPVALRIAGATLETPVSLRVQAVPLGKALATLLRPLGLTFTVNGDVLVVTYDPVQGKDSGKGPAQRDQPVLLRLEEPMALSFKQAPLEDVLKSIRTASTGPNDHGIHIYVDPVGLQEAEVTLLAPVTIDAKNERLKDALRKALTPLQLTYEVKDGLLRITSMVSEDVPLELKEDAAPRKDAAPR